MLPDLDAAVGALAPDLTLGDLVAAAERALSYPPEKQQGMARYSTLATVYRNPGCAAGDVVREQGLSPENAERALRQLCDMGQVRQRPTGGYEAVGGLS